jgi:TRAP-type C4-dicarboxylate transport system permease small subunit
MRTLNRLLTKLLEILVTLCVAVLLLVVLWGVLSRFIVDVPSRWTEELASYLLAWVALLGGAIGFRRREHLGVDYLYLKLDREARRWNAVLIDLLVFVFVFTVMVVGGSLLVWKTWKTGQVTAAMGIRMGVVYLCVPLSGVLIALFTVEEFFNKLTSSGEPVK